MGELRGLAMSLGLGPIRDDALPTEILRGFDDRSLTVIWLPDEAAFSGPADAVPAGLERYLSGAQARGGHAAPAAHANLNVDSMSLEDRFVETLKLVPNHLGPEFRAEFEAALDVEGLIQGAAIALAAWAVSHLFGIGFIISGIMLVTGLIFLGRAVFEAAEDLLRGLDIVRNARSTAHLNVAARRIAGFISRVGVQAFFALLRRVARGAGGRRRNINDSSAEGNPEVGNRQASEKSGRVQDQRVTDKSSSDRTQAALLKKVYHPRTKEEFDDLARDWGQNGRVYSKSIQERTVGLGIEERGDVPGPIRRDQTPASDFIDATGQPWDVKGFHSGYPPKKGGFDLEVDAAKIDRALQSGENIMLDTSKMSPADIAALRSAGEARGWGNRVQWWP